MAATYIETEAEFDTLLAAGTPLVVDCTASWCGPCKLISPLIDQLADAYLDQAKVMKLDLDNHKAIAKRFELRSIPAVMYFKAGELNTTLVGVKPYEDFQTALESLL
jgi:thioredoxin 1